MALDNGDFFERAEHLNHMVVGINELTGSVEVNQHYALEQHERFDYEHPRGGGPKYLSGPLMENAEWYLTLVSEALLKGAAPSAMAGAMEHLSSLLDPAAPIDEDPNPIRLRRSGHPVVMDNGQVVYDRPPRDPREPMMAPDDLARAIIAEDGASPSF